LAENEEEDSVSHPYSKPAVFSGFQNAADKTLEVVIPLGGGMTMMSFISRLRPIQSKNVA